MIMIRALIIIGLLNNIGLVHGLSSLSMSSKQPFQFGRFLKTISFFKVINPLKSLFGGKTSTEKIRITAGSDLWTISNPLKLEWGALDDVVMGGVSKTEITSGSSFQGRWKGFVTDANNGGFAGIRTRLISPALDLSFCQGLVIKLSGDGQRYKFIAREDEEWNGIAWSTSFDTNDKKSIEVKIPFDSLKPTRFAKILDFSRKFNSASFTGLQFTLSKFEYDGNKNVLS